MLEDGGEGFVFDGFEAEALEYLRPVGGDPDLFRREALDEFGDDEAGDAFSAEGLHDAHRTKLVRGGLVVGSVPIGFDAPEAFVGAEVFADDELGKFKVLAVEPEGFDGQGDPFHVHLGGVA